MSSKQLLNQFLNHPGVLIAIFNNWKSFVGSCNWIARKKSCFIIRIHQPLCSYKMRASYICMYVLQSKWTILLDTSPSPSYILNTTKLLKELHLKLLRDLAQERLFAVFTLKSAPKQKLLLSHLLHRLFCKTLLNRI